MHREHEQHTNCYLLMFSLFHFHFRPLPLSLCVLLCRLCLQLVCSCSRQIARNCSTTQFEKKEEKCRKKTQGEIESERVKHFNLLLLQNIVQRWSTSITKRIKKMTSFEKYNVQKKTTTNNTINNSKCSWE